MGNHGDNDGGYRGEASHVRTVLMYLLKRLYAGSGKADRRCFFKNELQNGGGEGVFVNERFDPVSSRVRVKAYSNNTIIGAIMRVGIEHTCILDSRTGNKLTVCPTCSTLNTCITHNLWSVLWHRYV